jgi:Skp family chaperone for outer membrane proteins
MPKRTKAIAVSGEAGSSAQIVRAATCRPVYRTAGCTYSTSALPAGQCSWIQLGVLKMRTVKTADPGHRNKMIAEAAYFRAEQRGFNDGDPLVDWVEAEAEISAQLSNADGDRVLHRLEERLATANERLKALRKKLSRMKADARTEWQHDAEKLAALRDALRMRLEEVRERGEQASRKAQKQAEKIWEEISEIVQRTAPRRK